MTDFPTWIQGNGWWQTFSGQSTPGRFKKKRQPTTEDLKLDALKDIFDTKKNATLGFESWGTQMIQWTANEAMPGTVRGVFLESSMGQNNEKTTGALENAENIFTHLIVALDWLLNSNH